MQVANDLIRMGGVLGNLSLRWAHMSFCWFYHDAAQIITSSHTNGLPVPLPKLR